MKKLLITSIALISMFQINAQEKNIQIGAKQVLILLTSLGT